MWGHPYYNLLFPLTPPFVPLLSKVRSSRHTSRISRIACRCQPLLHIQVPTAPELLPPTNARSVLCPDTFTKRQVGGFLPLLQWKNSWNASFYRLVCILMYTYILYIHSAAFQIRIHPDPLHLAGSGSGSTSNPSPDPDPDPDPLRFLSSDPDPLKKALIWIRVARNYLE